MSLLDKLPYFAQRQKFLLVASGELADSDGHDFESVLESQVLVRVHEDDVDKAQLISSEVAPNGFSVPNDPTRHKPLIDIDFEAALLPSTTPGHHHLYLDKELTWDQYKKLLDVLAEIGIIGKGYHKASIFRKMTTLRLPWVKKGEDGPERLKPAPVPSYGDVPRPWMKPEDPPF